MRQKIKTGDRGFVFGHLGTVVNVEGGLLCFEEDCNKKSTRPCIVAPVEMFDSNMPPCYDCIHAQARGPFRLCKKGEEGYRHVGEVFSCKLQEKEEKEKKEKDKWGLS